MGQPLKIVLEGEPPTLWDWRRKVLEKRRFKAT